MQGLYHQPYPSAAQALFVTHLHAHVEETQKLDLACQMGSLARCNMRFLFWGTLVQYSMICYTIAQSSIIV